MSSWPYLPDFDQVMYFRRDRMSQQKDQAPFDRFLEGTEFQLSTLRANNYFNSGSWLQKQDAGTCWQVVSHLLQRVCTSH